MSDLLVYAKELLDKLTTKSSSLNWKVEDIQKDLSTLKCGFDSLKEDVAVLESASSELLHLSSEIGPCLEEHSQQTEKQLPNIQKLVEDKKSAADILEEFTHPCGGSGWKLAVYRDFRDPDTPCPPPWQQTMYSERPYTCGRPGVSECSSVTFSETANLEYSKVCGRNKAYQFGTALGFFRGFIVVHTASSEIWRFTAGITQSQVDPSLITQRCPCDGVDPFPMGFEYYFCESLIEEDNPGTKYDNHFFHNEVLWDKAGCSSSGDCCSRFDSPYFIRHLPDITDRDPLVVTICNFQLNDNNFAIELIEFM